MFFTVVNKSEISLIISVAQNTNTKTFRHWTKHFMWDYIQVEFFAFKSILRRQGLVWFEFDCESLFYRVPLQLNNLSFDWVASSTDNFLFNFTEIRRSKFHLLCSIQEDSKNILFDSQFIMPLHNSLTKWWTIYLRRTLKET